MRPQILGILNITSDSFSDGGLYLSEKAISKQVEYLIAGGANRIDIGVESSNPNGQNVEIDEQIERLRLAYSVIDGRIKTSIDSYRPQVVEFALRNGTDMINDISGFVNPDLRRFLVNPNVSGLMMHNRSLKDPRALDSKNDHADIVDDIHKFFEQQLEIFHKENIGVHKIIFDPGMGFFLDSAAKTSFYVLEKIQDFVSRYKNICISVSRKSFLRGKSNLEPLQREEATLRAELFCIDRGVNHIRTHNVLQLSEALRKRPGPNPDDLMISEIDEPLMKK